jgi:hypothetical protein
MLVFSRSTNGGCLENIRHFSCASHHLNSVGRTDARTDALASRRPHCGGWRLERLEDVRRERLQRATDKVGEISDVIINSQGRVKGAVVEVGGFLGMGTHYVLIAMDSLKFANKAGKTTGQTSETKKEWYPDRAVLNVTKEQLKAMPEFKY